MTVPEEAIAPPPPAQSRFRRTFSALSYRDFRILWLGALTSTTGTWMQTVAQSWLVLSMTGSAFLLGVDSFLATIPIVLFSLVGGVLADRMDRRRIMLASQLAQMVLAFLLAFLVFARKIEVWQIFVLSFLTGTAQAFSGPAYISLLPMLVRREDVQNAVAMNSMQFNLARVIGPVAAGFALTSLGAAACFGLNGLSFLAVVISLLALRHSFPTTDRAQRKSILEDTRDGFSFLIHDRSLAQLSALAFVGTFLGVPVITMLPVVAKELFAESGARGYSWLLTAYGVGSVFGALFVASTGHVQKKGRLALTSQLVFSAFLLLFANSTSFLLSLFAAACAGACLVGVISMYSSLVQLSTTEQMRGRVMSIFMFAFRGGMPLGNLTAGWIAERWSVALALGINAVLMASVASWFLATRSRVREL